MEVAGTHPSVTTGIDVDLSIMAANRYLDSLTDFITETSQQHQQQPQASQSKRKDGLSHEQAGKIFT